MIDFHRSPLQDYEALGVAQVLSSLMIFFKPLTFLELPHELLQRFVSHFTRLTCSFGDSAAREQAARSDETLFMEAYEKTLDAWMTFLNDGVDLLVEGALKQNAVDIFNGFLKCHLSDGSGGQSSGSGSDEEYEDEDEDDRERFKDQLCCIGAFGRLAVDHAVPLLSRLLEERVGRLHGQLQRIHQSQRASSPSSRNQSDAHAHGSSILNAINEDLHWLILIAAHVLTDEAEGETPVIPSAIMRYSLEQSKTTDLTTTLQVLASPGDDVSAIPGSDAKSDTVVRLCAAVLRLCEVERRAADAGLGAHLSPQVASSSMWFLRRWAITYLLPNESYYSEVSFLCEKNFIAFLPSLVPTRWRLHSLLNHLFCVFCACSVHKNNC